MWLKPFVQVIPCTGTDKKVQIFELRIKYFALVTHIITGIGWKIVSPNLIVNSHPHDTGNPTPAVLTLAFMHVYKHHFR